MQELELLEKDAAVYRLIGPVLLKQEPEEAKMNVVKRLEFLQGEMCVLLLARSLTFLRALSFLSFGLSLSTSFDCISGRSPNSVCKSCRRSWKISE
jgi:hypothetical protein